MRWRRRQRLWLGPQVLAVIIMCGPRRHQPADGVHRCSMSMPSYLPRCHFIGPGRHQYSRFLLLPPSSPPPSSPLPCKLGADARWIQGDEAEQQSMAYNPYIPAGRCSGRPGSSARWGPGAGSSGIAHIHGQGSIHSSHTIGWCMLPRLSSGTG